MGAKLLRWTEPDQVGLGRPGFANSESRLCMGGTCWRRWNPSQSSKLWGLDYESWEWSGGSADTASEWLRGCRLQGRPSRVDVAFDFQCEDDYLPEHLEDRYRAHVKARGVKRGVSGSGGVNTLYVGSPSSDHRLRIYRKDRQLPAFAEMFGPVLRVELILKGKAARPWWSMFLDDRDKSMAGAAGIIEGMTGIRLVDDVCDVPALDIPVEVDAIDTLFYFIRQHGDYVAALHDAGVSVEDLACDYSNRSYNRLQRSRYSRRLRKLGEMNIFEVVSYVRHMLKLPEPGPSA